MAREYFTVDLRGLRGSLRARATTAGMTESDVLRSALAASLGEDVSVVNSQPSGDRGQRTRMHVKLSVRLSHLAAHRLDQSSRGAGLSRGAYLMSLIDAAPPVLASADRAALADALSHSAAELAIFSRDINHLTQLLRQGSGRAAQEYRGRLDTLDSDVRGHLDRAAAVLAELALAPTRGPRKPATATVLASSS